MTRVPVSPESGLTPAGAIYQNNAHAITLVSPALKPRSISISRQVPVQAFDFLRLLPRKFESAIVALLRRRRLPAICNKERTFGIRSRMRVKPTFIAGNIQRSHARKSKAVDFADRQLAQRAFKSRRCEPRVFHKFSPGLCSTHTKATTAGY